MIRVTTLLWILAALLVIAGFAGSRVGYPDALLVSARARGHIVRVARTITDLDASELVLERHIAEAVGYREKSNA